MKENISTLEDIYSEIDITRDLCVLLAEYFNNDEIQRIKEGNESQQDIEILQLISFKRLYEENYSLLCVIMERLKSTQAKVGEVIQNMTNNKKKGE